MPELNAFVPSFNRLSPIQQGIVEEATTSKNSYFIEGPPGSGKTLISLHIVKSMIGKEIVNPLVLIYNKSLYGFLKSAFNFLGIKDGVTISTKDSFFWGLKRQYNVDAVGRNFKEKHRTLLNGLENTKIDLDYNVVIVDEVQDFYETEIQILKRIGRRFISLGDFDQRIFDGDLKEETITSMSIAKRLYDVYRFDEHIANIVGMFSLNDRDLKTLRKDANPPLVIDCDNHADENESILKFIQTRKTDGKTIAVISISRDRLQQIHKFLTGRNEPHLYAESNEVFKDYDFSQNGVVLITSASAKGLEFSTVIAVGFDNGNNAVWGFRTHGGLTENIYVCLSRATDYLYVLRNPQSINELHAIPSYESEDNDNDWF